MKAKYKRLLFAFALAVTIPIQSISANAANLSVSNQIQLEKKAPSLGDASVYDTTDGNTDVSWPAGPNADKLSSDSAILMDVDTGLILYGKNITEQHYPASITKILTSLLCVENSSLDEIVTFTEEEVTNLEYGASNINTQPGEKLTMDQCLYGVMLSSANEVCNGVADYIGGSTEGFAEMMNAKAAELGCINSNFMNSNGLHNDNHYTCAYDMALIGRAALQNETFKKVAGTKVYYMDKTNKSDSRTLTNHHNMLYGYSTTAFINSDCIGGKTGFTSMAQSTLVTFAQRNNTTLVCVVMHGTSSKTDLSRNIYTDTKTLLDFGFEKYTSYDLSSADTASEENESPFFTTFDSIYDADTAPLKTNTSSKIILPNKVNPSKAKQEVIFYDGNNETKETDAIGNVSYTYGNKIVGSTDIYFNSEACSRLLAKDEDITYKNSKQIAGKKHSRVIVIRRIGIVVSGVFLVGVLLFYFLVVRRNRQQQKRYQNTRNKY